MFEHTTAPFGAFTKHKFFDAASGNGFTIVPEVGGTMLDLWLGHRSIISGCQTPEELENNQAYKSSLLFPFPNRLDNGKYKFLNDHYQFDLNDSGTQNALHGLGRDVNMDVLKSAVNEDSAWISLSYFDHGRDKAYPFPFLVDAEFRISNATGFELKMRFTNEAEHAIPVGLGWHPYFKLDTAVDHLQLKLPACEMIEIDERMLPTGNHLAYDYFASKRPIGKAVLDNAFLLKKTEDKAYVHLSDQDYSLSYWQETGPGKCPYLQVYTPPSRDTIAIEPMTCNIDAFNNGEGLVTLGPEESLELKCGVMLTPEVKEV